MAKIMMSDDLRNLIRTNRKIKNLTVPQLSELINKGNAYISQLESGKISRIDEDLLNIILSKILDDEATIQSIIHKAKSSILDENEMDDEEIEIDEIKKYESIDEFVPDKKAYDKMVNILTKIFETIYEHDDKKAFITLSAFLKSCRTDLGFVFAIMGIPFFKLENLSHKEKQELLDKTSELYKSYM